jgi:lipopolysaccharide/colanic/teichoic acid biosynthesis glycosyltransferase/peptidoglycan/LPS O-acetylase OafA/YrhL
MNAAPRPDGQHSGSQGLHLRERIVAVQLLRGIAASLVVAYHLIERYQRRGALQTDLPLWVDRIGEVGVLVFFVISGFIMVYTAFSAGRAISAGTFLRDRFTRIAPFYYLTTLLIVGFRLATEGLSTKAFLWPRSWEWVASLLFIPYRNAEGALQPIYKLGWTLNYEMAFYLLFAGGLLFARRKAGAVVCLALLAIVAVGTMLPEPRSNGIALTIYFLTRPILLYFAIGMALGLVFLRLRRDRPRFHPYLVALAACGAVAQAVLWPAAWSMLWVGLAVAIVTLVDAPMQRAPRFARFCTAFGNASFAIYLTHSFVLGAYAAVTVKLHPDTPAAWLVLVVGACLLCFGIGWTAWRWIERPMTGWLRQDGRFHHPPERRALWVRILKGASVCSELMAPELADLAPLALDLCGGTPTMVIADGPLDRSDMLLKRAFDIALAGTALFLLSPLMLLIALLVKLSSPGPVFFIQTRIGQGNHMFRMLKFRSMRVEQEDSAGHRSAAREDSRVTAIGRLIRKTSLDELPQLLNVLRGDMSIVGPRPHALGSRAEDKLFWEVDNRYWHRHAAKPGLTGLAQVRGFRGATEQMSDLTNRLQADLEYVHNWSLWRDFLIVIQTFKVILHRNAF